MIFSPNTPQIIKDQIKAPMGIQDKEELGVYLGCPMDVNGRSSRKFEFIKDKITKKISSWKFSSISQAGKIILWNSILSTMTSHISAQYSIPQRILSSITSIILCFWWRTNKDRKPIYWRAKNVLELHQSEGGLGLRNLQSMNHAMCFKQAWRIHRNPQLLVSKLMLARYKKSPIDMLYSPRNVATSS